MSQSKMRQKGRSKEKGRKNMPLQRRKEKRED
jgi:hypothetical protein